MLTADAGPSHGAALEARLDDVLRCGLDPTGPLPIGSPRAIKSEYRMRSRWRRKYSMALSRTLRALSAAAVRCRHLRIARMVFSTARRPGAASRAISRASAWQRVPRRNSAASTAVDTAASRGEPHPNHGRRARGPDFHQVPR